MKFDAWYYESIFLTISVIFRISLLVQTKNMKIPVNYANLLITLIRNKNPDYVSQVAESTLENDRAFLTQSEISPIIYNIISEYPKQCAGLLVGKHQSVSTWGGLGYAIMTAQTLHEAIALGVKYQKTTATLLELKLDCPDNGPAKLTTITCIQDQQLIPFATISTLASLQSVYSAISAQPFKFNEILLPFNLPDAQKVELAEFFQCPISYQHSHPSTQAYFEFPDNEYLPMHDKAESKKFISQLNDRLKEVEDLSLCTQVKEKIEYFGLMDASQEKIAKALHQSTSKLLKGLEKEGTNYRKIMESMRHTASLQYLAENLSICDTAELCGYSDASNFRKAFVRWEGVTPTQYKSKLIQ